MKYLSKLMMGVCGLLAAMVQSHAQDLHFSQYFNAPILVNPANTGFNPDFDYRFGGNYRNQWSTVTANPYKTMSVWGDAQLLSNRLEDGWLGVGGLLLKDEAGSGTLSSTKAFGSIAYHQMLGYKSLISGGFNVGFVNKRIDVNKLTFDNQWNGKFFDVNINPNEPFQYSSVTYFTLQAGINYAYFASDKLYVNMGVSMANINTPRESFFAKTSNDDRLQRRYTMFANASMKVQDVWIFSPNVYVSKMGNAWEYVFGLMAQRDLSAEQNGNLQLLAGIYNRGKDAIIPMVGFDVRNFKITFSYDATTSTLKEFNNSQGAYEISVVKSGLYSSGERPLKCPTVHF